MNDKTHPLLYTFRRCPYAIRARMAIYVAGINVREQEVSLRNKPQSMLDVSAKGTVPVLCVGNKVIEESLEVMLWALDINDPDGWYSHYSESEMHEVMQLVEENDSDFKHWLDKYKYANRFPEHKPQDYRQQCERFLQKLENILQNQPFLAGIEISLADIAIFPFVRQFAMVDRDWFEQCEYQRVRVWLETLLELPAFIRVMQKKEVRDR